VWRENGSDAGSGAVAAGYAALNGSLTNRQASGRGWATALAGLRGHVTTWCRSQDSLVRACEALTCALSAQCRF